MFKVGVVLRCALGAVVAGLIANAAIASAAAMSVSTTPSNYPVFSTSVSDYVIRSCPSTGGVTVNVTTDPGESVSVDGQPAQTGTFSATVNVTTGQEFAIVGSGTTTGTWYMRCLPSDFPGFTSSVTGTPQAKYYLTAPVVSGATSSYLTMFNNAGVPVWWYQVTGQAIFATKQPNGSIAWTINHGSNVQIVTLTGTPVATITSPDGAIDFHDFQSLPNGDSLVEVDENKCCTDLSSWGTAFPSNATIYDQVIEEINSSGTVVWSWDALAHIDPVVETNPQWYSTIQTSGSPYDVFHMNSVDYQGGHILVSFRHLDAIYDINQADGSILWKIGGHTDPQSLTVVGDPVFTAGGTFCGQHDARNMPDGTITLHDNGTNCGRGPRAVHYSINTTLKTATLLGSVSDSRAPSSLCCGSARLMSGGDWVTSWGYNDFFTELTSTGTPVYTVTYPSGTFSYRVRPIYAGTYSAAQLRNAMNTQYPR